MKYFSIFSGIAGFERGIEDAEKSIEGNGKQQANSAPKRSGGSEFPKIAEPSESTLRRDNSHWECVGYSEIDRYASAVYRYHYPDQRNYGDATKLVSEGLPDFDCIVAGFPCQSFSIAGKRGGFEDTRGTLFFEICRIARAKGTKYLLLENVKGLLSHDSGNTFQTIVRTLDELGYDCQWQVLNSKDFGVPQNRQRVFIIGNLRGQRRPEVFPLQNGSESANELCGLAVGAITSRRGIAQSDGDYVVEGNGEAQERMIVQAIDANYAKGNAGFAGSKRALVFQYGVLGENSRKWLEDGKDFSRNFPQGQRVYSVEGISAQINSQGGGWGAKTGLYEIPLVAQALQTDGQLRNGVSWGTDKPQSARNIRRLTPTECERLQGFPDGWCRYGLFDNGEVKTISDSQRYKCLGNAVTTNVVRAIVLEWIRSAGKREAE